MACLLDVGAIFWERDGTEGRTRHAYISLRPSQDMSNPSPVAFFSRPSGAANLDTTRTRLNLIVHKEVLLCDKVSE